MKAMKQTGLLTVISLIVAALGVISPIVWDWYRNRAAIELQCVSRDILFQKAEGLDKLAVTYNGTPVRSLARTSFILVNSGRRPIQQKDLIIPPTIRFPVGTRLLEVKTEQLSPRNADINISVGKPEALVRVSFLLLNPGDYCQFSVLASGDPWPFQAEARIVGIRELDVVDNTKERAGPARTIPWAVYPVAVFTSFLVLVFAGAWWMWRKERTIKRALQAGTFNFPSPTTPESLLTFVQKTFDFTTKKERAPLKTLLSRFTEKQEISEEQRQKVQEGIHELMRTMTSNGPAALIIGCIAVVGLLYLGSVFVW